MVIEMKKYNYIFIYFLILLAVTVIVFSLTDYLLSKNNKVPIFTIKSENKSQVTYQGMFYKIIDCKGNKNELKFTIKNNDLICYQSSLNLFTLDDAESVRIIKDDDCNNTTKLYYEDVDRNYYTYCLKDILLKIDTLEYSLKDFLNKDSDTLNAFLKRYTKEPEGSYDDGGSKLYSGNDFNVLSCSTLLGNKDIYIGNKNMGYFNSFCKRL